MKECGEKQRDRISRIHDNQRRVVVHHGHAGTAVARDLQEGTDALMDQIRVDAQGRDICQIRDRTVDTCSLDYKFCIHLEFKGCYVKMHSSHGCGC